ETARAQPRADRGIVEATDVVVGGEGFGADAEALGHACGPLAEGHRGDVEEPARLEVLGLLFQDGQQFLHRLARAVLLAVDSVALDRRDARLGAVVEDAVGLLADPQPGQRAEVTGRALGARPLELAKTVP